MYICFSHTQVEDSEVANKKEGNIEHANSHFKEWSFAKPVIGDNSLPGEMGKPVTIPKSQEKEKNEKFKINQFNLMASEMISLNRSLADVRLSA